MVDLSDGHVDNDPFIEDKALHTLLKLGMWWPEADSDKLRDAAKA
ncbi:hypothetical protein [Streptomyces sp. NPDC006193]